MRSSGYCVPWDQTVKGYEYESSKFVVLKDEYRPASFSRTEKTGRGRCMKQKVG